jgi:prefoldin alpha subunit
MNDEKIKQLYMEMQVYQKQLKQFQEALENINNKEAEIAYIKESLTNLSDMKEGDDLLVPINNGIFVKAKLVETEKVLVNVGSDIVVQKDIPSTQTMMDKQLGEIKKYQKGIEADMQDVHDKMSKIEQEFKKIENV